MIILLIFNDKKRNVKYLRKINKMLNSKNELLLLIVDY